MRRKRGERLLVGQYFEKLECEKVATQANYGKYEHNDVAHFAPSSPTKVRPRNPQRMRLYQSVRQAMH